MSAQSVKQAKVSWNCIKINKAYNQNPLITKKNKFKKQLFFIQLLFVSYFYFFLYKCSSPTVCGPCSALSQTPPACLVIPRVTRAAACLCSRFSSTCLPKVVLQWCIQAAQLWQFPVFSVDDKRLERAFKYFHPLWFCSLRMQEAPKEPCLTPPLTSCLQDENSVIWTGVVPHACQIQLLTGLLIMMSSCDGC